MRGRTDARMLMHGALLLSALVSMANCGHTGTDCEDCEATLYQERAAWQLERARLESELNALRERLDSKSARRLVVSTLTSNAHTGDGAADRPVTSHLGNTSALARPSRKLQQAEVAESQCSPGEVRAALSNPAAVVTAIFETNLGCAMCLIPCG